MKKKSEAARDVTTYFEQIPVAVVKKLIERGIPIPHPAAINLDVESAAEKTDPYIDWKRSF